MPPNPDSPSWPSVTSEQLAAFQEFTERLPLVPTILIKEPGDPHVTLRPSRWRPLDDLVAELGTRFHRNGIEYDITQAVQGQLGKGLVAALVLEDPTTPRPISPQELAVLGPLPPAPPSRS
jgi:hypothetical protein